MGTNTRISWFKLDVNVGQVTITVWSIRLLVVHTMSKLTNGSTISSRVVRPLVLQPMPSHSLIMTLQLLIRLTLYPLVSTLKDQLLQNKLLTKNQSTIATVSCSRHGVTNVVILVLIVMRAGNQRPNGIGPKIGCLVLDHPRQTSHNLTTLLKYKIHVLFFNISIASQKN